MKRILRFSFLTLIIFGVLFAEFSYAYNTEIPAQESIQNPVLVKIASESETITPGQSFWIGVQFQMEEGWHIYWKNPGDVGLAPIIDWRLPEGFQAREILWPQPERFEQDSLVSFGYKDTVLLLTQVTAPANLSADQNVEMGVGVRWLACNEECVPGWFSETLKLPVVSADPKFDRAWQEAFDEARNRLSKDGEVFFMGHEEIVIKQKEDLRFGWAILLAFFGGMLLNLMPCVLPVISLKVMSFVNMAGNSRKQIFRHGLYFTLGVLVSFWILASVLLILRHLGEGIGWGFQLQEPAFVAVLTMVLFALGLSLLGVFEIGTSLMGIGGFAHQKKGIFGTFFGGVLATVVATPCTGPLLAPALGFAMTLTAGASLLVFTAMGLGMAFPYLLLTCFPKLLVRLPKPGPWMVAFKKCMSFLLFATVIWLIWVFQAEISIPLAVAELITGLFVLGIACWIYGRWGHQGNRRYIAKLATIGLVAIAGILGFRASLYKPVIRHVSANKEKGEWMPWNLEKLNEFRSQGVPVFVNFTARWCLICQVNKAALHSSEVREQFQNKGVVLMEADWTMRDPAIMAELEKFGRNGVPLYVLYGTDSQPLILPQILTPKILLETLK